MQSKANIHYEKNPNTKKTIFGLNMSIVVFPDHQSLDTSKFDTSQHRGSMNDVLQMLETENESDRHVLVVDDESISRTVLRKMIERLNFDGMYLNCITWYVLSFYCLPIHVAS